MERIDAPSVESTLGGGGRRLSSHDFAVGQSAARANGLFTGELGATLADFDVRNCDASSCPSIVFCPCRFAHDEAESGGKVIARVRETR